VSRVLITRPQEDAGPLAALLVDRGCSVLIEPMLEIEPLPVSPVTDLVGVQGLLFTSANGVRACGPEADRSLPVYAVGAATANAARQAGFRTVNGAGGDVASLARLVTGHCDPEAGRLLHITASDRAGDLSGLLVRAGFVVRRLVLYRARPATGLSATTRAALAANEIDAVLLFSPRTARTLIALIMTAGLLAACRNVTAVCLSAAVAEAIGEPESWRSVHVAGQPDQEALLAELFYDRESRNARPLALASGS